jgi:hypothetical protein
MDDINADTAAIKAQTDKMAFTVANQIDANVLKIGGTTQTGRDIGTLVADMATAVWDAAVRSLTAGTNIVLAKGTGVTGFNDISAADVNAACDTAISDAALATTANLLDVHNDIATVASYVDTEITAIKTVTDKLGTTLELDYTAYRFTANALEMVPAGESGSAPTVEEIDIYLSGVHGAGSWGAVSAGSGAIAWSYDLTDGDTGDPIADADVWVSTDQAGANVIASGKTDQSGRVMFDLDAGTIYVWRQKSGWNFANPDSEVVS